MSDSLRRVDVEERPPTPAVVTPLDVPDVTLELDVDMDREYVEFFATVLPQAVGVARRITGDLASAEDAASVALAKAYLRWPKLRPLAYREAWVLRVTTNEALGTVRKQARRERILRGQPPPQPGVDDQAEARALMVDQIRRLPNRQRQVVALRFYADLSTDQVAATLGISAGSVKSHLHRALHSLRLHLGDDTLGGNLE